MTPEQQLDRIRPVDHPLLDSLIAENEQLRVNLEMTHNRSFLAGMLLGALLLFSLACVIAPLSGKL